MNISYTDHFVAYIDVLGFSDLVTQSSKSAEKKAVVEQFYKSTSSIFSNFKKLREKSQIFTLAASDTIVLAVPGVTHMTGKPSQ